MRIKAPAEHQTVYRACSLQGGHGCGQRHMAQHDRHARKADRPRKGSGCRRRGAVRRRPPDRRKRQSRNGERRAGAGKV